MLNVSQISSMQSTNQVGVIPTASRIKAHSQPACDSVSFGCAPEKIANAALTSLERHQQEQIDMIERLFGERIHEAVYRNYPDGRMKVFLNKIVQIDSLGRKVVDPASENAWGPEYLSSTRIRRGKTQHRLTQEINNENNLGGLASKLHDFLLVYRIKPITDKDTKWEIKFFNRKPDFYPLELEMKAYKQEGTNKYGSLLSIGPDSMAMYPMADLKPSMQQELEAGFNKGNGSFCVRQGGDTFELKREMLDGKPHIRVSRTTS